jgi:hypothetical protein
LRAKAATTVDGTWVGVHPEVSNPGVDTTDSAAATSALETIFQPSRSTIVVSACCTGASAQEMIEVEARARRPTTVKLLG